MDAFAVTAGGMRLHRRYAREKPSKIARGSSVCIEGAGTAGRLSTIACIPAYSVGATPDTTNDGGTPSIGADGKISLA